MKKRLAIIGAGFSGISAAAYLARDGNEVHVFEKNTDVGGRARQLHTTNGFVFDMGPSWYWMPDVFEKFFNDFGFCVADLYDVQLLDPAFEVVFGSNDTLNVPAGFDELCNAFELIEPGSAIKLRKFMDEGAVKYHLAMERLIYKPGLSLMEYLTREVIFNGFKTDVFVSFSRHVKKYFTHRKLIALMEFPILFLGGKPSAIPALYSLMNYAGLKLGTWYPQGGFGKVVDAMVTVAKQQQVKFHLNSEVERIHTENNSATGIMVSGERFDVDGVVATGDYQHIEEKLLNAEERNYHLPYWDKKTMAPSALIFYLGINKKLKRLNHHTLFFDEDLEQHTHEIYSDPQWPANPLFYVCCTSKSDRTVAPEGCENIFVLMPIATGLADTEEIREKYFNILMDRLESFVDEPIRSAIIFKKSYCSSNFIEDYHSYKGNAYGLANTLAQTAIWKPKMKNHKIKNLFYAGQLTVPGPGVPPAIISGNIAAGLLNKYLVKKQ